MSDFENFELAPYDNFITVYMLAVESFVSFASPVQANTIRVTVGGGIVKTLNIKQNDTRRVLEGICKNPDKTPVDLTNASVLFTMVKLFDPLGLPVVSRAAEIVDAEKGMINFQFEPAELDAVGRMKAEFTVTYPDGHRETFPNQDYIPITVQNVLTKGV